MPRTHLIDDIAGIVAGVVRRDRFVRLLAAIAVALSLFLGHSAWADENSNAKAYKLFMSALEEAKLGDPVNSTEALKHLDNAIEMIERLVREYPDTVLARRLSTGQVTGSFQLSELKMRRDEAMVRICLDRPTPQCLEPLARLAKTLMPEVAELKKQLARRDEQMLALAENPAPRRSTASFRDEDRINEAQKAQVALLNRQVVALREELRRSNAVIESAEQRQLKAESQVVDLGRRLNAALANKVRELQPFRTEALSRLRAGMADGEIIGEHLVIGSDDLFESGSTTLSDGGKDNLRQLATTLQGMVRGLPSRIDWVLRINGHSDKQPISTARFPSNWELSAARAIEVAKYLAAQGIPPERLAPTSHAEFRPLDRGDGAAALRRNRRIELRLTTP